MSMLRAFWVASRFRSWLHSGQLRAFRAGEVSANPAAVSVSRSRLFGVLVQEFSSRSLGFVKGGGGPVLPFPGFGWGFAVCGLRSMRFNGVCQARMGGLLSSSGVRGAPWLFGAKVGLSVRVWHSHWAVLCSV